ncbi:MAG: monomeric [FeFe] hydrogenase [Chitinispirillaceae bacterium]
MHYYDNNATRTRRSILVRIARLFFEGKLAESVDRIPLEMRPRNGMSYRCCVYKDRAIIRYRIMSALGYGMEDETSELEMLESYSNRSLERKGPVQGEPLSLLEEACSACVKSKFFVTNACRGCMARPCTLNCPKKAIYMNENGQAVIDSSKCVNCGICMKVCPYHSIIRVPVPCEEACPAGAIEKDGQGRARIDFEKCILCGKCMRECPFGAIMERSQMIDVLKALKKGKRVVAIIAPAATAQFVADYSQLFSALKLLGFADVVEVAQGATVTSVHEGQELLERLKEGEPFMTSSCCPSYVLAVDKHIPALKDKVSATASPMHYTAQMVKENDSDSVVVFVGPCVAKRSEARHDPLVDWVLTSEELASVFAAAGIDVMGCETEEAVEIAPDSSRMFPISGKVTEAVAANLEDPSLIKGQLVDGLNRQSMKLLKVYASKGIQGNFLEVMACEGGCVNGPCTTERAAQAAKRIAQMCRESREKRNEVVL